MTPPTRCLQPLADYTAIKFKTRHEKVPIEKHTIQRRVIRVYRADEMPTATYSPFVKTLLLPPFLRLVKKQGFDSVAWYAGASESQWVASLVREAKRIGLRCFVIVPIAKNKEVPAWFDGAEIIRIRHNMWKINWYLSKREVEQRAVNPLMIPIGINTPLFVGLQQEFFRRFPPPKCQTMLVPVGSGTALSGLLRANDTTPTVIGVANAPSIGGPIQVLKDNGAPTTHCRIVPQPASVIAEMTKPWPLTKAWERSAYTWMLENLAELQDPICFLSLGR